MSHILECIHSFERLLPIQYEIYLGRKGVLKKIELSFHKKDCFHLMGLQYLADRPDLNRDREQIFNKIKSGEITEKHIITSDFYPQIKKRIHFLPLLEPVLDSSDFIFKYNKNINRFSRIEADYLIKYLNMERNLFLFLSKEAGGSYFCRSFFPENVCDYSKNQPSWTLLYKKKIDFGENTEKILFERRKGTFLDLG